jgi:hypothetical protein
LTKFYKKKINFRKFSENFPKICPSGKISRQFSENFSEISRISWNFCNFRNFLTTFYWHFYRIYWNQWLQRIICVCKKLPQKCSHDFFRKRENFFGNCVNLFREKVSRRKSFDNFRQFSGNVVNMFAKKVSRQNFCNNDYKFAWHVIENVSRQKLSTNVYSL